MKKFWTLFIFVFLVTVCMAIVLWWLTHRHPADVVADFGNRTSTITIPANFFGAGGVGSTVSAQSGIDNITNVNLLGNRIWANIDLIYAKGDTPDYSLFDAQMVRATQKGLDPMITVNGTPPSLGPSSCSVPSNMQKWGQLAAAVLAHLETTYPGRYYELWNEPDGIGFCGSTDPLGDYLRLYGTAIPMMKQAAPTGKFGGPSLCCSGNTATWIPALLSGTTAPYVDFVSFHIYITGTWLLPGMTWDQAYQQTQKPDGGLAYYYHLLEQYVRQGQQPNAAHTPIFITEYNTNYAFAPNDVQNTPVYGPLWNMVAVADFLNVVTLGSFPPSRLNFFAAGDVRGFFCLEGIPGGDPKMCAPPTAGQPYNAIYAPYPPLTAYQLLCAKDFLDLESQGFNVVMPPPAPYSLLTAAFYTPTADTLMLINPTANSIAGLKIRMKRLGMHPAQGRAIILANNSLSIATLRVGTGNSATIRADVPAYSTVAITLQQQ